MKTQDDPQGCDPDRLWAFAVGVLADDELVTQESHVASCTACRARLDVIQADVDALACFADGEASPEDLANKVLDHSRALQSRARRLRWLAVGALLIGALVAGLVAAHSLAEKALAARGLVKLEHAIQRIQNAEGRYPNNEQELIEALARHPSKELTLDDKGRPLDRWGRPFHYRYPGEKVTGMFDLWSVGADGVDQEGAPDDHANWR